jgi:putative membrane protein
MEGFFGQLLGTVALRPYFFAFFLAYLLACSLHLGLKRALLFAVAGYAIAWAAEYSSIHNGIPFGSYYYIPATKGRELWVLGVPFMDSMSFVFLAYASYTMALFAISPAVRAGGIYLLENRKIRHSFGARLLGALFVMYLDIVIDPVALRGDRWFLGLIYGYAQSGVYFGVPISNFIGWFCLGFILIWVLQLIDRLPGRDLYAPAFPLRYIFGPALYCGVMLFNMSMTLYIGEYNLLWADIFIVLLPLAVLFAGVKARLHGTDARSALEAHLRDFPDAVVPGRG